MNLFDPIRQRWVAATPEEKVRQAWLHEMVHVCRFPRSLVCVEKRLEALPLKEAHPASIPRRRIDVLAFYNREGEVRPLLLMECKTGSMELGFLAQVRDYNSVIQAPYVAVATEREIILESGMTQFFHLPSFQELIQGIKAS